jgi:hypothetical protein
MHLVLRILFHDPRSTCLWIDTEASFDADRVKDISARLSSSSPTPLVQGGIDVEATKNENLARSQQGEAQDALERLELAVLFDLEGVKQTLNLFRQKQLDNSSGNTDRNHDETNDGIVEQPNTTGNTGKKVIVIDSIGPLLGPCLVSGNAHGESRATGIIRMMPIRVVAERAFSYI